MYFGRLKFHESKSFRNSWCALYIASIVTRYQLSSLKDTSYIGGSSRDWQRLRGELAGCPRPEPTARVSRRRHSRSQNDPSSSRDFPKASPNTAGTQGRWTPRTDRGFVCSQSTAAPHSRNVATASPNTAGTQGRWTPRTDRGFVCSQSTAAPHSRNFATASPNTAGTQGRWTPRTDRGFVSSQN